MGLSAGSFQLRFAANAMASIPFIHNGLLTAGLVQTADTGQLSMASPPTFVNTANNSYGYNVYKFNDAAQSTLPLFLRIEWRNQNVASPSNFMHYFTLGTGSDGAGNITGVIIASTQMMYPASSATPTAINYGLFVCGDGSGFYIAHGLDYIDTTNFQYFTPCGFLLIDRGRNSSGVANATSAMIASSVNPTTWRLYSPVAFPGTLPTSNFGAMVGWPWALYTEGAGSVLPAFPYTWLDPAPQISKMVLSVNMADYGPFSTFSATHLGAAHTFIAHTIPGTTSGSYIPGMNFAQGNNSHSIALLYE